MAIEYEGEVDWIWISRSRDLWLSDSRVDTRVGLLKEEDQDAPHRESFYVEVVVNLGVH